MRKTSLAILLAASIVGGCAPSQPATTLPEPTPAQREAEVLSDITQLTFARDFERAGEAYFSQDMRSVVFQAVPKAQKGKPAETGYQMYVARINYVEGRPVGLILVTRVSPPGSRNTCGWISDDGSTLMFASTAGKDDPEEASPGYQRQGSRYRWAFSKGMEIYAVRDWQRKVRFDASEGFLNFALPENRLTDNDAYDAEGSYSPDGKWVIFCSDRPAKVEGEIPEPAATQPGEPVARPKQLWAMRSDGTGLVQLTATPGYNGGPFFSPDGRRLVYRSDRKGNDLLQVFVSDIVRDRSGNITGLANERPITDDAHVNWGPYWTPDGRRVVYSTSKVSHTNYEIFSRRADGSRETRLTFAAGPDVLPVISPDGKWMMWSSRRGNDTTTQVYIARIKFPKGS